MLLLTRKLQKVLLICLAAVVAGFLLITQTVPSYTVEYGDLKYYQDIVTNFAKIKLNQFPQEVSIDPKHRDTSLLNSGKVTLERLKVPPLKTSKSPQEILKLNQKIYDKVIEKQIDEPKSYKLTYKKQQDEVTQDNENNEHNENNDNYQLENAAFVSLVRNSEVRGIVSTIKSIEQTFNHKYNYPYVFLNDKPFSERFKKSISKLTKAEVYFETIEPELWDKPGNIDPKIEKEGIRKLKQKGVGYASKLSYHNMCRFYSKNFFNTPILKNFRYYWRIEPNTKYFCDIDYDVFKFMKENDKIYGFVLALYDSPDSIETLWPTTLEFLSKNPSFLHPNSASIFLTENIQNPDVTAIANNYSTCHFWSNFEIGDMNFFRDEAYTKYVDYLENSGGFYYERWGDAPVHSVGVSLFADKNRIHWFRDIGYEHFPYTNCPNSERCHKKCVAGKFSPFDNLNSQNCMATWIEYEMSDKALNGY